MTSQRKYILLVALLTVAAIAVIAPILIERFVRVDTFRDSILSALRTALNRPITYSRGTFSPWPAPSFTFDNIVIKERAGEGTFASAESVTFKIAILPLLQKKVALRQVVVEKPVVTVFRDVDGKTSIDDLITAPGQMPLQIKGLKAVNATIRFIDNGVRPAVSTVIEQGNISISRFTRGKPADVQIAARIGDGKYFGEISAKGHVTPSPKGKPFLETTADLKLSLKRINGTQFWPYYSSFVQFNRVDGLFTLESSFKGTIRSFSSKGALQVRQLRFDYPSVFHAVLTPKDLEANFQLVVDPATVVVKSLALSMDGLKVKGACSIADIPSGDPHITADAVIAPFRLQEFKHYIPYGIIVKDTSEFIEKYIHDGTYRLLEGRLNGRASQIAHMEKGANYKVLYIRGTVEDGLLSFGKSSPTFNTVNGTLQLFETDFILSGVTARFGTSPFSLEGRIKDYCLDHPSTYPFRMTMTPNQPEAAWLFGPRAKLHLSGTSNLSLTGDGPTDNFGLTGDWNLTSAAYSAADTISKPTGTPSTISFKGAISDKGATLSNLRFSLSHLQLTGSGAYRTGPAPHLTATMKTNQFPAAELSKFAPSLQKHDPRGTIALTLSCAGNPDDPAKIHWKGNLSIDGGSGIVAEGWRRITDIKGTVGISGTELDSSLLVGKIGTSTLYTKGSCSLADTPSFTVSFSSPMVDMADLGYSSSDPLKWSNLQGNIQYRNNTINIRSLSGKFNNSPLKIRGKVEDLRNPHIDVAVTSSFLEGSDLIALAAARQNGARPDNRQVHVKASLEADAGRIKKIPFKNLHATATFENGILYLQPLEMLLCGGKLTTKGRFDVGAGGLDRYQASFDLQKASAEQLMRAFEVEGEFITGTTSIQGDLTARGQSGPEIRKSLLGWVKIRSDEGMLRRFSVLSKIFSILNLSQLLKFQLPDMVSGGMPYNHVTGSISFQNGIASTKDLFVDSDAMNISIVGKGDLVREEIDLTVGVQPLQTIDKVVNRIPIVGWILTGKGKSLITSYFEAKGSWHDPSVSAIPVKAIGKGVFDIFKRVFQLPEKLFTDTGEVIIGK